MTRFWLLLASMISTLSVAQEVDYTQWSGKTVAYVQIQAPAGYGGLPAEDLLELLAVEQGDTLDPNEVRGDLITLFRAGEFSSAEARIEQGIATRPDGSLDPNAIVLTYYVLPPPRVGPITLEDVPRKFRSLTKIAFDFQPGEVFYPELDMEPARQRIQRAMVQRGYLDAQVKIIVSEDRRVYPVRIQVTEGPRTVVGEVSFLGLPSVPEKRLRQWVRAEGIKPKSPATSSTLEAAADRIERELVDLRRGLTRKPKGWLKARVLLSTQLTEENTLNVAFTVSPGTRTTLNVRGYGVWGYGRTLRELSLTPRSRITERYLASGRDRLLSKLSESGFMNAAARVTLEAPSADEQHIEVEISKGRRFRLGQIRFTGGAALSDKDLKNAFVGADTNLRRRWFSAKGVTRGIRAIEDAYRAIGYQQATVILDEPIEALLTAAETNEYRVNPSLTIEEGPLTRFGEATLSFVQYEVEPPDFPEIEAALREFKGQTFAPSKLTEQAKALRERARGLGYLDVDVRILTSLDEDGVMNAQLLADLGPQVRLRALVLRGEQRTKTQFLLKQLDLSRGQLLTPSQIEEARQSLLDLGVFRTVRAEVLGDLGARDLLFTLEEKKRWSFDVGGGINTDQGIQLYSRVTRRNVFGLAHEIIGQGQIGLNWSTDVNEPWFLNTAQPDWRLSFSYRAPRFPSRSQTLGLNFLIRERDQERTYALNRFGFSIQLDSTLSKKTTLIAGLSWDLRSLFNVQQGALLPGEPWYELLNGLVSFEQLPSPWRPQESLWLRLVHDRRNSPVVPTRGLLLTGAAEWSPGIVVTNTPSPQARFVKVDASLTGYIPLGLTTLRMTGEGGYGYAYGGTVLPLEDRFRLGGTGSVRGFRRDAIGPMNRRLVPSDLLSPALPSPSPEAALWTPTGGDTYARAVIEWSIPFRAFGAEGWDGYSLAIFADAGNAWLTASNTSVSSNDPEIREIFNPVLRTAVGFGPRLATPIGPIQLDLAFPIDVLASSGARADLLKRQMQNRGVIFHLTIGNLW